MKEILFRSITAHQAAMQRGEYTSLDLTRAFLTQIEKQDRDIGAFLTVDAAGALAAARASDERRRMGECRSALDGIPYAAKDNFCTKGLRTTCASKLLREFVPPYDATVIAQLREAGAVLLGKLNLDEFAMGSSTEGSALQITRNPHDLDRVPGGSSGGSAAALAAGMAAFTIGSDTGGSVRQPASFCGVVGIKPTYGVLSRYGLVAMSSSMDTVGLLTHGVEDGAQLFSLLAQRDEKDDTARAFLPPEPWRRGLRVGILEGFEEGVISASELEALELAKQAFAQAGAEFVRFSLPAPRKALAAYSVLVSAEASSNLARFDGVRYGARAKMEGGLQGFYASNRAAFGKEVTRRILFGNYVLKEEHRAAFYESARAVQSEIRECVTTAFSSFDVLLSPTTPTTAFGIGEVRTPTQMYHADLCTVYANLAGLPALALPFGREAGTGLPLSVQLSAAPFCEASLFSAAQLLERALRSLSSEEGRVQ